MSFPLENTLLEYFLTLGIGYFFPIVLSISLLFILPVFLASQTIPLLSELIHHEKKSIILGKLLFFSTIGSFLGSVITSLVFFAYIGVEKSIIINGIILAVLACVILFVFYRQEAPQWMMWVSVGYLSLLFFVLFSGVSWTTIGSNVIHTQSSEYNDITIYDNGTYRLFSMN